MTLELTTDAMVERALLEDLSGGDITTDSLFPQPGSIAKAIIRTRQPAVLSGLDMACAVFQKVDPAIQCASDCLAGDTLVAGDMIMSVTGPVDSLLRAERVALNFLQHLSGVATLTYQYVGAVSGTGVKITHTRKTTPGLRAVEIQAVLDGGGSAHRRSLSHAVMIKDNHIQAAGSITRAVEAIRNRIGHTVSIEVECDTAAQVDEAVACDVKLILLDNMKLDTLRTIAGKVASQAVLEASGGVSLGTVLDIARTGVHVISTSQITLSAPAVDIGLDFE